MQIILALNEKTTVKYFNVNTYYVIELCYYS